MLVKLKRASGPKLQNSSLKTMVGRSLAVATPFLQISLPHNIRSCKAVNNLKSKLKTFFLFKQAFGGQYFTEILF